MRYTTDEVCYAWEELPSGKSFAFPDTCHGPLATLHEYEIDKNDWEIRTPSFHMVAG